MENVAVALAKIVLAKAVVAVKKNHVKPAVQDTKVANTAICTKNATKINSLNFSYDFKKPCDSQSRRVFLFTRYPTRNL